MRTQSWLKTELPLLTEIEYYQGIRNINKNAINILNIIATFEINSIDFSVFCFYM